MTPTILCKYLCAYICIHLYIYIYIYVCVCTHVNIYYEYQKDEKCFKFLLLNGILRFC